MSRILLLGGTGFIGRELGRELTTAGHTVVMAVRSLEGVRQRLSFSCELHGWPSVETPVPVEALAGCDAVVNLVGAGIADKAWTRKRRTLIRDSRVGSVQALAAGLRAMTGKRPSVVVQASAIGFYGDRGDDPLDETSGAGEGFLAETGVAWESVDLTPFVERVVTMRFGLVLGRSGGAFSQLVKVYKFGFGAVLGSGRQWVSWIHVDDLVRMIHAAIADQRWCGVVNGTAPRPVRFEDFNASLAKHGGFSADKHVRAAFVRLAMGRRSALVLDSTRVIPKAAMELGFAFRYPDIDTAFTGLFSQ